MGLIVSVQKPHGRAARCARSAGVIMHSVRRAHLEAHEKEEETMTRTRPMVSNLRMQASTAIQVLTESSLT